jgi:hypothetical protein
MRHLIMFESQSSLFRLADGMEPNPDRYEEPTQRELKALARLLGPLGLTTHGERESGNFNCICHGEIWKKRTKFLNQPCPAEALSGFRVVDGEIVQLQATVGLLTDDYWQVGVFLLYAGTPASLLDFSLQIKTLLSLVMVCDGLKGVEEAVGWAAPRLLGPDGPVASYESLVAQREANKKKIAELTDVLKRENKQITKKIATLRSAIKGFRP